MFDQLLLAKMSIQELFDKLLAPVLDELRIRFQTTIEGHADLPWPRKHLRILDGGFVLDGVGRDRREPFDHVQLIAMEIARPVEPCLVVEIGQVDDQGVPLPVPD